MPYTFRILSFVCFLALPAWMPDNANAQSASAADPYIAELDELSVVWSFYKHAYMQDGKAFSPDEGNITTSEAQSYAMLRAVWSKDRATFDKAWNWTQANLQREEDNLFAWKWKGRVLDPNAATDADTDIALALILASRRFNEIRYLDQAKAILADIWAKEILIVNDKYYVTGGNWARGEDFPTVHVGYLAPYAYEIFAQVDSARAWKRVISTSYEVLNWIFLEKKLSLPPMRVYVNKKNRRAHARAPRWTEATI